MTGPVERLLEVDQSGHAERGWVIEAISKLKADQTRSADTHLHLSLIHI